MKKLLRGQIIICVLVLLVFTACSNTTTYSTPDTPATAQKDSSTPVFSEDEILKQENEAEKPEIISIAAVGDIMCHKDNLTAAYDSESGEYDFTGYFEYVEPFISEADLAIANFETVTAGEEKQYTSFPLFNTPDAILEALSDTGFDVLTTANNHCLDRGSYGLTRTIEEIRENGMDHVGTSTLPGSRFIIKEVKGINIALLSYTYGCNGNIVMLDENEQKYMVNLIDEEKIKEDLTKVRDLGADVVIASMHWGVEYHREPNTYQTDLADKMFSWGADIILGSHPHVVQGSEIRSEDSGKYIIYSMGNFISNYRREDQAGRMNKEYTEDGVIVSIELEKAETRKGEIVEIKSVKHIPTWVDKYFENDKKVFKILPIPDTELEESFINESNRTKVQQSYINTMELMQDFESVPSK